MLAAQDYDTYRVDLLRSMAYPRECLEADPSLPRMGQDSELEDTYGPLLER